MADFKNQHDVEQWLHQQPATYAKVLLLRTAVRCLPICSLSDNRMLRLWRAGFLSWAICQYQLSDHHAMQASAAAVNEILDFSSLNPPPGINPDDAAALKESEISGAVASIISMFIGLYLQNGEDKQNFIRTFSTTVSWAKDISKTFHAALIADANFLESNAVEDVNTNISNLITRPLWSVTIPHNIYAAWENRKADFLNWGRDWEIWIDWYDQRLKGSDIAFLHLPISYDDVTSAIAMEADAFWNRTPGEINTEIKARLDAAKPPITEPTEPLPGYYHIEIENDRLTAKPVAPETAQEEFALDMLEALRELVSDTRSALDQVQDDTLLTGLLDRLETALTPDIHDLRVGRLAALRASLAAQAAAHDDPSRESHSTIRGALNGLNDTLENLLAQFNAVRDAKASQIALQITTSDLSALENALDQFTEIAAQSTAIDQSVVIALSEGKFEQSELDVLASPIGASPQRLQTIASQRLNLNGQRLVTIWNVTTTALKNVGGRFGKGVGDGAEELGKELTVNSGRTAFMMLLHSIRVPMEIIAMLVPSFLKLKQDIKKLEAPDKKKDKASDDDKDA